MSIGRQITHLRSVCHDSSAKFQLAVSPTTEHAFGLAWRPRPRVPAGGPDQQIASERSLMKLRVTTLLIALFTLPLPLLATPESKAGQNTDTKTASADSPPAASGESKSESKQGEQTV